MNQADPPSADVPAPGPSRAWEDAPTLVATDAPTRVVRDLEGEWVLAWEDGSPLEPGGPRYELRGELARGGLGRIHFAWDRRLARAVAIKEPLTEGARARFYREALLTARLQHPGIVPIYDAGNGGDGAPFYAMRLLEEGRSFSGAIAATSSLDERLTLLPHVIAAADAVAYAHDRRIIHRDLKPDNILLGPFGETVVIDWGLAKDLSGADLPEEPAEEAPPLSARGAPPPRGAAPSSGAATPSPSPGMATPLTLAGTTVGTPAYMSPEQIFQGLVDERTDVYSLGAVLLELLLGKRSAAGGRQAIGTGAELRRLLPPGVPADLVAILRTAMAEEPQDRYPSARELAADLRRFAAGQLVKAHAYSPAARLARWISRHRWPFGIAAASLLLLALFAIAGVRGVIHERNLAEEKNDALTLVHARTSLDRDPTATVAWMATYREEARHQDLLRSLVAEAAARGVARHILKFPERVRAVSFARNGELLVGADYARFLRVYGSRDGSLLGEWERPGGTTLLRVIEKPSAVDSGGAAAGRLAGIQVLTGGVDGRLLLFDLETGEVRVFTGHGGVIRELVVLEDGLTAFSSAGDGSVYQWDLAAGRGRLLTRHQGSAGSVAVSADRRAAVSAGLDGTLRLLDLVGNRPPRIFATGSRLSDLAIAPGSPAGALRVATAGDDFRVRLWNLETGESQTATEHGGIVAAIAFSPDGRLLASVSRDRTVRVTEIAALESGATGATRIYTGHTDDIETLVFSPDGRRLASAGLDGTVRLVELETGRQQVLGGAKLMIERLAFSPDGEWLAAGTQDQDLRLWKVAGEEVAVLDGHRNDVDALLFIPGAGGAPAALISAGHDKRALVWRREGEAWSRTPLELAGHTQTVYHLALLPGGRQLVSGSDDHDIRIWDLATGASQRLDPEQHGHSISGLALAEGGRVLISSSLDGAVCVWDLDTGNISGSGGQPRHRLAGHDGAVHALALSPDGRILATGGADRQVRLWDWRAAKQIAALPGHDDQVGILAFSPDGKLLASGSWNGGLRLWQGEGFARGQALEGHTERVRSLVFSPDGKTLASSSIDKTIRLWDMPEGRVRVLYGHEASVRHVVFSPDGSLLSSSSTDRTARLWDVASGELRALRRYDAIVTVSAFSADGKFLAVGGWDKLVHVYPFRPEALLPIGPGSSRRLIRELTTVSTDENGKIATRAPAP
jgi:WD40 repeat protein